MENFEELRIVMRNEGDMWVAQCIDLDIATQGRTPAECRRNMVVQLECEAALSLETTGELFGGVPKAPDGLESHWQCAAGNSFEASGHLSGVSSSTYEMRMVG